ncbi:hypothetical protein RUND412_007746 [Rhizina undulata]
MYIYYRKFNWSQYIQDELITIVLPGAFALNDPICAYWQWTTDDKGREKTNCIKEGVINSISKVGNEYIIGFVKDDDFKFEARVANGASVLEVTMTNPKDEKDKRTFKVDLHYSDKWKTPNALIYTGKLNWFEYVRNEMITLVAPTGLREGHPVCIYYQWTKDGNGVKKVNHCFKNTIRDVKTASDGGIKAQFGDGYFEFSINLSNSKKTLSLEMTNPSGDRDGDAPYTLQANDFRTRIENGFALTVRYDVGPDKGIFDVQNMFVNNLAFNSYSIEMPYYDSEPENAPRRCTSGQQAPTAQRFKQKFVDLIAGTKAGDVRFLYVAAHGSPREGSGGPGKVDRINEGWRLAGQEDGQRVEIVYDDWLSEAIRTNLAAGVNLTILTSSCPGDGMFGTQSGTPGVILAGCHESQAYVAAFHGEDVWTKALLNEAKEIIRFWIHGGFMLSDTYKGFSPDHLKPIPCSSNTTSHQDPQLVFCEDYININSERFLYPFAALLSPSASHQTCRVSFLDSF